MNKRHFRSQPNCTLSLIFFNSFYILRSLNYHQVDTKLRSIVSSYKWIVLFFLVYGKPLPRLQSLYTGKTQYRNLKQISPEKEMRGLSTNFHIQVSVSYLYIPTNGLPIILLQEIMWTDPENK
jgi:hypothetical protein